jgi:hypothetical protein
MEVALDAAAEADVVREGRGGGAAGDSRGDGGAAAAAAAAACVRAGGTPCQVRGARGAWPRVRGVGAACTTTGVRGRRRS